MPIISSFEGISIRMYFDDHNPPHFHADYGEFKSTFDIESGKMDDGFLPPKQEKKVEDWGAKRKKELFESWEQMKEGKTPKKIDP